MVAMSAATRRLTHFHLSEAVTFEGVTVDREAGVIRNVKVLGRTSRNRRTYTEACQQEACARGLYEGAPVYIDHARDHQGRGAPYAARKASERFGTLRAARQQGDATRADLYYLTHHPMAAQVAEAAEKGLARFGLSHNAECEGERHADGSVTVHTITEVRSVDVVDDPATADSFLEQTRGPAVSTTYHDFFEAWERHLPAAGRRRIRAILEQGDDYLGGQMSADAPPMPGDDASAADAGDAIGTALQQAIVALVEKAMSGEMDKAEAIKKIRKLFNTHTAVSDQGATAAGDDEEPAEDNEEESAGKSEQSQYRRLNAALVLCEQHDFRASKKQLDILAAVPTDELRLELLETFKTTARTGTPYRPQRPQPGQPARLAGPAARPVGVGTAPMGVKELAAWLKG